jgi:ActR/RegA family two-component response regulator
MNSREPRVIVLASDALYRGVLARRFEKEGWEVEESMRAEDAERRAVQFLPHVVVVEMQTREEVEFLLRRWKTLPTLRQARVIVEAHELSHGEAERLLEAGAATIALRGHQTPGDIVRRAGKELP